MGLPDRLPYARINHALEGVTDNRVVSPFLNRVIDVYASSDTIVDTHSGFTTGVVAGLQEDGMTPSQALRTSAKIAKGNELNPQEVTTLYFNTAIGGLVEFGARAALHTPGLKGQRVRIGHLAQTIYDKAGWVGRSDDCLSPEEFARLNLHGYVYPGGECARYKEIERLRRKYGQRSLAARQIDRFVYDTESKSGYGRKHKEYRKALKAGDEKQIKELEEWFIENGYL